VFEEGLTGESLSATGMLKDYYLPIIQLGFMVVVYPYAHLSK
jgi:hypothetical protein